MLRYVISMWKEMRETPTWSTSACTRSSPTFRCALCCFLRTEAVVAVVGHPLTMTVFTLQKLLQCASSAAMLLIQQQQYCCTQQHCYRYTAADEHQIQAPDTKCVCLDDCLCSADHPLHLMPAAFAPTIAATSRTPPSSCKLHVLCT